MFEAAGGGGADHAGAATTGAGNTGGHVTTLDEPWLDEPWLDERLLATLDEPALEPSPLLGDDADEWLDRLVALDPARPLSARELLTRAATEPPGAVAATLAEIDPAELDDDGLVELARLWHRAENIAVAGKVAAVAAFAGDEADDPDSPEAFAWAEIAPALGLGDGEASRLVDVSRMLTTRLPATYAAMTTGALSWQKARCIAQGTVMLSPEQCIDVEERVLPKAARRSTGWCDKAVRRAVDQADPDGLRERHAASKRDVVLAKDHIGDGMGELYARMTSVDLETVYTGADAYARRVKADGDDRTLEQLRVAALVDWAERFLTGPDAPRRHGRPITVNVAVDLTTFLGLTDHAAEVLPAGALIPAEALRELVPHVQLRRIITDPMTGELLDVGRTTYRVPAATAAFVAMRDVTATTPTGSAAPASAQDIDHIESWASGGRTDRANLHSPTRRWHRARTIAGWLVRRNPDGSVTWTSPHGRRYRVEPHDYRLGP